MGRTSTRSTISAAAANAHTSRDTRKIAAPLRYRCPTTLTAPVTACTTIAGEAPHTTKIAKVKQTDSVERIRGSSRRTTPNSGTSTNSAASAIPQKPLGASCRPNRTAPGSAHTNTPAATAATLHVANRARRNPFEAYLRHLHTLCRANPHHRRLSSCQDD